jgi:hypothetical protein
MNALPAYLQSRQSRIVAEGAADGIGGSVPPHISIKGNVFTLVDAAGNKQVLSEVLTNAQGQQQTIAAQFLDLCVIDRSDVICKQFYEDDYVEGSDNPPTCWSANGVAPSIEASKPQSARCDICEWNRRGSDVSKISGKAIKACRDEKWTAVILPKYPAMVFQLKITPGSFVSWKGYVDRFKGQATDLSDVVTRIKFEGGKNGVLTFEATNYIDEALYSARERAAIEKKADVLVGRLDRPIQGVLAAPSAAGQEVTQFTAPQGQPLVTHTQQGTPTAPAQAFAPTASPFNLPGGSQDVGQAPATGRRKRRTKEEIAADNARAAPAGGRSAPFGQLIGGGQVAPFRPAEPAPATSNPAPFGLAPAVAPDPAMSAMLDGIFGPAKVVG